MPAVNGMKTEYRIPSTDRWEAVLIGPSTVCILCSVFATLLSLAGTCAILPPVTLPIDKPIQVTVGELLIAQKKTLAVAESCTGGVITDRLTNVPGSSAYLIAGVVAYAYEAKVVALGVTWETLNRFGAVSKETARAMAKGARERFGSTLGLAVTGIAGPGGGMPDKPVGLTYIALVSDHDEVIERHVWQGNRLENKAQSADAALRLLKEYLQR